jgi:hypothetical protein
MKRDYRLLRTQCPFCNDGHDAIATPEGDVPQPDDGDFSFCFTCGEWAVFDIGIVGTLRKPTWEEYTNIAADPRKNRMRAAWLIVMKEERKVQ